MTNEEYLIASGWRCAENVPSPPWMPEVEAVWLKGDLAYSLPFAVETQLAEDRARYNFVRERSTMEGGMLVEPSRA